MSVSRPLLVELVGLPGAGKTAVADRVLEHLRAQGLSCGGRRDLGRDTRLARVAARVTGRIRRPAPTVAALRFALGVRPFRAGRARHAVKAANWALRIADPPAKGWDLAIVDQGIVQEVWSTVVGSSCWNAEALRALLSTVFARAPIVPAFVHFQVEPSVALERVRGRPSMRSRFDRMSHDRALRLLERHNEDLELASRLAVEVTAAHHRRIDASASIPELCREVAEFVESCGMLEGAAR